jgi:transposase-like protein
MPRPRKLTPDQERAALTRYLAGGERYGLMSELAREHDVSLNTMKAAIARAASRETQTDVSRETTESGAVAE